MKFRGYDVPLHTTPVPDQFFDEVLAEIDNLAELKVVLYHMRRTFGFGKVVDRISYTQFVDGIKKGRGETAVQLDWGTGLSRPSITSGLKKALAHGYLVRFIVCPHCDRELSRLEEEGHRRKARRMIHRCPYCRKRLRGGAHYYYGVPLLSTELSTLGKDVTYPYLKFFTRGSKELLPALGKVFNPQETDKQETGIQETDKQQTDSKQAVVAVVEFLSAFGFKASDSQAIAEEALEAGLTVEDVARWIEYVCDQASLTNPKGFLRAKLRSGEEPPAPEDREEHDPDRYISGKYADYIKY